MHSDLLKPTKNFEKFAKEFFDALGERKVMVFGGGIPVIHESVVTRGKQLNYRPENLQALRHTIWGRPDVEYKRFSEHFADG